MKYQHLNYIQYFADVTSMMIKTSGLDENIKSRLLKNNPDMNLGNISGSVVTFEYIYNPFKKCDFYMLPLLEQSVFYCVNMKISVHPCDDKNITYDLYYNRPNYPSFCYPFDTYFLGNACNMFGFSPTNKPVYFNVPVIGRYLTITATFTSPPSNGWWLYLCPYQGVHK